MSTSAASHLSPAFPMRAPWGTADALRAWQQEALSAYLARSGPAARDFLAVATPGAGKTTFALRVASELLERRLVEAVTVVAPTEHLKHQWADAASRVGISLDPQFRNAHGAVGSDYTGVAVTYAQVAAHPVLHRRRTEVRPTLVILDEVHHGGDALSWGDAVREAFDPATRRLALTGTPFRSDTSAIPFVTYAVGPDGVRRSAADYSYGYGRALADGVVRPVIFLSYSGQMRWRTRAGDEVCAVLGEPLTKDLTAQAWRTALDPQGNWIPQVLAAADRRLTEVRHGRAGRRRPGHRHRPGLGPRLRQRSCARITGEAPDRGALRRGRRERPDRGVRRPATTAGWSPCGWSRKASTCPGCRRRLRDLDGDAAATSPRRSGASCGPGGAARPRRSSCRRCRCCCSTRPRWRSSATTPWTGRRPTTTSTALRRRGRAAGGRPTGPDRGRVRTSCRSRRSRPRRHFDRVLFDGGEFGPADGFAAVGSRGGGRLPRPARAARAGPGGDPAAGPARAGRTSTRAGRAAGGRPADRRRRRRRTGRSRRCARSSTGWSAPGTTGPASRTARCTPSCVRPAAGRWPRRPAPSSCRPGST